MSNSGFEMSSIDDQLIARSLESREWALPTEYKVGGGRDAEELGRVLHSNERITVEDNVTEIANELFEIENPSESMDGSARSEYVASVLSEGAGFGSWFHFPWSDKLVRYPSKEDHQRLRTARNEGLISRAEQAQLLESTVAVFGLSVGGNIAERLVASGSCGKIILADMDTISPSNLNRIGASMLDVGDSKISAMAKKISEIDPYITQVHLPEGVNSDSLKYIIDEHDPDLMFDEVDNFAVKAEIRHQASEAGIPVAMLTDADRRSLIDVERYDIDSSTLPFGGRLEGTRLEQLREGKLTPPQILEAMIDVIEIDNISPALFESQMKVGVELAGLPQLGSTATLGAVVAEYIHSNIVLGRDMPSGRSYIDLAELALS